MPILRPRPALAPLVLLALLLGAGGLAAQQRVEYEIRFPNRAHHEAEVTAAFHDVPAGRPLEVRMSRTSPGRYALHEFAKNVYAVRATDGAGRPLAVTRPDPHQWDVAGHDGTVVFAYTLFADRADGTYSGIDRSHAHLNVPATFVWARGMEAAPVRVRFETPEGWRVATQLVPTADPATFTAPHLQYFMDSPAEVSPWALREWTVPAPGGGTQTVRIAMHHAGSDEELDRFAGTAARIVAEQIAVFGEAPRFDYGTYTFIADYLPWVAGDGMEHRNSAILTSTGSLARNETALLNTLSHEFFHAWNVERIRPASLEPFDFEEANMSGELWFAEGFTSYYDDLVLRRAGVLDDEAYARGAGATLSGVLAAPGRAYFSPVEMSMQAPFVDAATSVDPHNRGNTFVSYYTWGAAVGMGLDLTLRTRFPGVTLDDFMREVWLRHGAQTDSLAPALPYTLDDLRRILGEVSGDTAFANGFFRRYVEGREVPDYAALLSHAGLLLRPAAPGRPWLGAALEAGDLGVAVASYPLANGSLHGAGITRGDVILTLGGRRTPDPDALGAVLAELSAGERVVVEWAPRGLQSGAPARGELTLAENPAVELVTYEAAGLPVTDEMRSFRRRWLGSRAGN
jgi:predicted metalloprotease with PDZ domain